MIEKTPGQLVSEAVAEIAKTLPPPKVAGTITDIALLDDRGNALAIIPLESSFKLGTEFTFTLTVNANAFAPIFKGR